VEAGPDAFVVDHDRAIVVDGSVAGDSECVDQFVFEGAIAGKLIPMIAQNQEAQ